MGLLRDNHTMFKVPNLNFLLFKLAKLSGAANYLTNSNIPKTQYFEFAHIPIDNTTQPTCITTASKTVATQYA